MKFLKTNWRWFEFGQFRHIWRNYKRKIIMTHWYKTWKLEQIVDNNYKSLTIAPSEDFWPLGLFRDKHSK